MAGSNDNPSPVELKARIRLLLMGASPAVAAGSRSQPSTSGASVAMEEESPIYLSATVLDDLRDEEAATDAPPTDVGEKEIGQLLKEAQSRGQPAGHRAAADSEFSREGLAYVVGYLAHKLRDVDSSLGTVSSQCTPGRLGPDYAWLERLSHGGLYVPSPQWLQQVQDFDVVFCAMHGADIDRRPGVIKRLREDLEVKYPRIDPRVVRKYAVTRTHLRLRLLQRKLTEQRKETERNAKRRCMYARSAQ